MKRTRGLVVEVESLPELDERLRRGASELCGWHLHGLDLTGHGEALRGVDVAGAVFLGCPLTASDEADLRRRGALVFPPLPDVPVDVYRPHLYSAYELYDTEEYAATLDARVYAWSRLPARQDSTLAQALHDHAVDEALDAWVKGRTIVGVMGGHAVQRGDPEYAEAARLGHELAATRVVASGGGPGAMEAGNLGAWMSRRPLAELDEALDELARVPSFRPDVGIWAAAARSVRERWPDGADSLGIPTWYYGHEPPNLFATAIAKYFANPTREAVLLQVCDAGIVFLPGAGGTVQEIFQDACENYYADESSVSPMVLVGVEHWTSVVPAWPLLESMSRGRPMEGQVHLVDSVSEAVALLA